MSFKEISRLLFQQTRLSELRIYRHVRSWRLWKVQSSIIFEPFLLISNELGHLILLVLLMFSKSWRCLLEILLSPINDALLSMPLFNFSVERRWFSGTGNFWVDHRTTFGRSSFRFHCNFAGIFFRSTFQAILFCGLLRLLPAFSRKVFWWLRLEKASKPSKFGRRNKFAKFSMSIPNMKGSEEIVSKALFALDTLMSYLTSIWIEHILD